MLLASSHEQCFGVCQTTSLLQDAPAGSLQLTGILGLAALVWGLYQLRGPERRGSDAHPRDANTTRRPPAGSSLTHPPKQAQSSSAQAKACKPSLYINAMVKVFRV